VAVLSCAAVAVSAGYTPLSWAFSDLNYLAILPILVVGVGVRWILVRTIESADQVVDWLAKRMH